MNKANYFILLAALISATESGCPSMCNCSETAVFCVEKKLESVPSFESLSNDPVIIDLSGNKINMIDNDDFSFDKSDRVKEVYLNNTELLDLDSEAFEEMENLQELYLGDNLLNSIPDNLIEHLPNMVLLDISNNHFSHGLPKIISKSLEVLAVANARITSLPIDSLKHLPNLKMLLLQQNNIKSIDPEVFANVNKNSFFVRLSYNVWDCSCENIQLFEFLAGRKFIDTSDPYQCLTSSGTYVNIYQDENIQYLKAKCVNKSETVKELSDLKENRLLIDAEEQLKEEEYSWDDEEADKPYSLVREYNDTLSDEAKLTFQSLDNETLDNYTDDEAYEEYEESDIFERGIDGTKEIKEVEPHGEYREPELPRVMSYDMKVFSFIAMMGSFIIGLIFGFCLNQFAGMLRHRNLEPSDSRTKLILP